MPPGGCWDEPQVKHNNIIVKDPDGVRHVGCPTTYRASPAPIQHAVHAGGALPLSGIRVLDLGAFVAGPYASTLLCDLGADVIKIESMAGDPNRAIFRSFTAVNRGKRCISVDMKAPDGLRIVQQLCLSADVVTSNFRPGATARLGVDAATLHQLKPELIVLETAAYGASGPRAEGAGFDMCFQALCGHDVRAGGVGNAPLWNRTSMVDFAGGLLGGIAIVQALYARARTGAGAELGTGLLNTGLYLLSELIQKRDGSFDGAALLNHEQTGFHPAEQLYQASDGWIAIAARDEAMAKRLVAVLGLESAVRTPRSAWREAVSVAIGTAIKTRSLAELVPALEHANIWVEVCCTNGEVQNIRDADLLKLQTIYSSEHASFGTVTQIGPLVRLSSMVARPATRPAPLPGTHTDELLASIGYAPADIAAMRERKIIR
jgi:crotonobetainyl-CoA:carnitine CoA-transferase CaiB-like acyl-CoA transferase